jgi:hypothetical protein
MRSRNSSTRRAILRGSLGLILAGCGGAPEPTPMPPDEQGIKQFAELYRSYTKKNKRAPKSLKELNVRGQGYPGAVEMLQSGRIVVQWGAPLTPEGTSTDAVLAYLKEVPEQGGQVLLQDGWTIKTMTADEFKAAPKAGGP